MSKPLKTPRKPPPGPADAQPSAYLLDGNVLVALSDSAHVHHDAAVQWFMSIDTPFAMCPTTQGTLVRMLLRFHAVRDIAAAIHFLTRLAAHPRYRFWPDDLTYGEVSWRGILAHRQVVDAYLATLARRHGGRLVTLEPSLAALFPDVVELIERPAAHVLQLV